MKQSADIDLKDDDGNSPYDLCDTKWPWLQHAVAWLVVNNKFPTQLVDSSTVFSFCTFDIWYYDLLGLFFFVIYGRGCLWVHLWSFQPVSVMHPFFFRRWLNWERELHTSHTFFTAASFSCMDDVKTTISFTELNDCRTSASESHCLPTAYKQTWVISLSLSQTHTPLSSCRAHASASSRHDNQVDRTSLSVWSKHVCLDKMTIMSI